MEWSQNGAKRVYPFRALQRPCFFASKMSLLGPGLQACPSVLQACWFPGWAWGPHGFVGAFFLCGEGEVSRPVGPCRRWSVLGLCPLDASSAQDPCRLQGCPLPPGPWQSPGTDPLVWTLSRFLYFPPRYPCFLCVCVCACMCGQAASKCVVGAVS